ncbi:MAG: hypothetical protein PHU85_07380 [Phycisphaerae bacterium]|nr:hypothetical protein [Phycisphaerae bacterium]
MHFAFCISLVSWAGAADLDEFKIKRQEVFEFTEKPAITRTGDNTEIRFASKGFCDVTIAIEDANGKIVRHLASGVLGDNAPEPFLKKSLTQRIVWDGKNDQAVLIDKRDDLSVRVSLGLRPQLERSLFWSPHKRFSNACTLLEATEEGVLMYEGRGVDFVKLYDHKGDYVRTVYPFPADKLDKAEGLAKRIFPQDGKELPVKQGFVQGTLLTSGTSATMRLSDKFGDGFGATVMASARGRIALGYDSINRLATDGTTGGLKLTGAKIGRRATWAGYGGQGGGEEIIGPSSMAFSPDGKTLYMTGYMWREFYMGGANALHGVMKLDFEKEDAPTVFAGEMATDKAVGKDNAHFHVPSSVATDSRGRVYVSDYMNDRIQVFTPDGKYSKTLPSPKPAKVLVSPKNGEVWVFSWAVIGISNETIKNTGFAWDKVPATLTRYKSLDDPKLIATQPMPIGFSTQGFFLTGPMVSVAVDWWSDPVTVWTAGRKYNISRIDVAWGGTGAYAGRTADAWTSDGVHLLAEAEGKWQMQRDFGVDAKKAVAWLKPPDFARQRLCVNPKNEKLYVFEDSGFSKSFYRMPEIDPKTGRVRIVEIPFDAEELCFDHQGWAYLRTDTLVARYDPVTWREIPWDYGEEHQGVGFTSLGGSKRTDIVSSLPTPGARPVCWNQGGMYVSPKGYLVVSCCSRSEAADRHVKSDSPWANSRANITGKPYTPTMYQGRPRWQEIHVWDTHGKLVYEDAFPGMTAPNGIGMDRNDNIYVMAGASRVIDGKPYWNDMTGTVIKVKPKKAQVISSDGGVPLPLSKENWPKRSPDLVRCHLGSAWVEGAEWFYGGVGWYGFNGGPGGGCDCWNSRFCIDLYGRSFAPEIDHYSVAVLDTNGNLVLRVGRYGNVDDGKALEPAGGPPNARSIGGDEVGLFHGAYTGVQTDKRLYIADAGNGRIASVKLNYHATEKVSLK